MTRRPWEAVVGRRRVPGSSPSPSPLFTPLCGIAPLPRLLRHGSTTVVLVLPFWNQPKGPRARPDQSMAADRPASLSRPTPRLAVFGRPLEITGPSRAKRGDSRRGRVGGLWGLRRGEKHRGRRACSVSCWGSSRRRLLAAAVCNRTSLAWSSPTHDRAFKRAMPLAGEGDQGNLADTEQWLDTIPRGRMATCPAFRRQDAWHTAHERFWQLAGAQNGSMRRRMARDDWDYCKINCVEHRGERCCRRGRPAQCPPSPGQGRCESNAACPYWWARMIMEVSYSRYLRSAARASTRPSLERCGCIPTGRGKRARARLGWMGQSIRITTHNS